jgi:WD40 repeat protein
MSAEEQTPLDEKCASLLAACHDALLAGETATPLTTPEAPAELRARLERDLACLRLLDQAWPRQAAPGRAKRAPSPDIGPGPDQLPISIGRFQVRRELGRGGCGIVFLAYDPQLRREVALKVPRTEALLTPDMRERFLREARAAAVLDHPNVVPVFDAGEVGPVCYIASAYCPGTTLGNWLKARAEPVPWQEAAALVATLAEAVQHAHANGVVHRDLKPSNVLLQTTDGRGQTEQRAGASSEPFAITHLQAGIPKITDFGLAKFQPLEPEAAPQNLTQTGALVGTPRYMAPEQAVGSSQAVGPAADIHALGAILYELLTGRPPFEGETVWDVLEQVRSQEPLLPRRLRPRLPRDLETICLKCLQKEPARRYDRAGDLAEDLRRFLAGQPIQARPVGAWERAVKWARRRPAAAALAAVSSLGSLLFVAGLVAGIVLIANAYQREKETREEIERTSYYNAITSAAHELSAGNWGRGEELLKGCPEKLRGWEWHYLKRQRHVPQIDPLPVGESVSMVTGFDLAFHPDGSLLAVPSSDNSVRVWDASTGRKVLTFHGHKDRVLAVAFSPDGRRLASTSEDKTVKVWDVTAGLARGELLAPVFTLEGHTDRVIGVAFSPDGRLVATAGNDGTVKVWQAATGAPLLDLPGQAIPNPQVVVLAFSPDGRRLAAGSERNTVKVWDLTTGDAVYTLAGHTKPILNVTFSPDGRRLISAGRDRVVKVWDLGGAEPGVLAPRRTLSEPTTLSAWCMALSPDGSRLAVGGPTADGNVRVYDTTTGEIPLTLRGDYRVVSVAFSPDGRRLAAGGYDRVVRLWDTTTGQEVLSLRDHKDVVGRVLFSRDGRRLASASADGTVRVWDASPFDENAGPPHVRTLGGDDDGEFFGVAFSPGPDGPLLASANADRSVKLWNVETGQVVRTFVGHKEAVVCVAISPDGRRLLSGSMDQTVKLWDAQTGKELPGPDPRGFEVMVRSVAFRPPDGQAFATASHKKLHLWAPEPARNFTQEADPEFVNCVTFSSDGKHLATVGYAKTAKVWNADTGVEERSFTGHQASVFCVAFHPTGKYLASGGSDSKVKLWDPATDREIHPALSGHTDYVQGAAFSPDGKYLATASWREVIVWDANSFDRRRTFDRVAGRIHGVAFSPDGERLAAAAGYKGKGEIKIWGAALWQRPYPHGP